MIVADELTGRFSRFGGRAGTRIINRTKKEIKKFNYNNRKFYLLID